MTDKSTIEGEVGRMISMKRPRMLVLAGIVTIVGYCAFTFISWALYPLPYSPMTNYLSRLGDFIYSPFGAYFYNVGCIVTGFVLFPFFVGLRDLAIEKYFQKYILGIGQLVGFVAAVALIMIGVFSEDKGAPHIMASEIFFILNFFVLLIISIALILNRQIPWIIPVYGIAIDVLSAGLALTVGGPMIEWLTVFGSLLFVGLITIHAFREENQNNHQP